LRLAIVNLFYPPDLAPSAHFAASLAEHRAALGDDVTVIAGRGAYLGGRARSGLGTGGAGSAPRVIRLWTPALGKETTGRRLGDYLTFLVAAAARFATLPRQDAIIALTTPPYAEAAALAHLILHRGTRLVLWSHDLYPDAAEVYGTVRTGGTASRLLRGAKRWIFRRVDHVVALDRAMLDRQISRYGRDGRPPGTVIPNWEPLALFPSNDRVEPWEAYADPSLAGRFVALYLGNLGYGHPTATIAEAAARLAGEGVVFLFVGGGVRYPEMAESVRRRGLDTVVFRDYVPKEQTPAVLAGAGCALISLDDASLGIMSPCKLHGSLAMGVPIVYVGPAGTNVDEAIATYGCGFSLRHGDVDGVVDAIRRLRDEQTVRAEMSNRARRAFEDAYSDVRTLPRFDALLDGLVEGPARPFITRGASAPPGRAPG
jgi:colanic acid biosynthesis glycosyl transferase WcaI